MWGEGCTRTAVVTAPVMRRGGGMYTTMVNAPVDCLFLVFQISVSEARLQEMHSVHQVAQFLMPLLMQGLSTQRLQLVREHRSGQAPRRGHQDFYQVRLPHNAIWGVATRQQGWPPSA